MVSVTVVVPTVIPVPVSLMVSAVIPVPVSLMVSAVIPVPMSFMICIFVFCQRGIFIILFSLPFPQFSALSSAPCLWFCGKTPCLDSLYANTAYAQTDTGLG